MDRIDVLILELLQENGEINAAEVARRLNLPQTSVWRRIGALEKSGVIRKRVTLLDPEKVGLGATAFVFIRTSQHEPDWLRRFALRAEAIRSHFTALAYLLDSSLGAIQARGSPQGDAVEAMVVASCCAARRFGSGPLWQFVSGASGGRLLSNTSSPFPALQ